MGQWARQPPFGTSQITRITKTIGRSVLEANLFIEALKLNGGIETLIETLNGCLLLLRLGMIDFGSAILERDTRNSGPASRVLLLFQR